MEAFINYIIDESCTIQDVDGNILYGILCESEDGLKDFHVHENKDQGRYLEYNTLRSADYFSFLDRSAYGKPSDMSFSGQNRKVYTLFLEYTGRVYISAKEKILSTEQLETEFKVVMVRCTDDIKLTYATEVQRNHSFRRFLEAKAERLRNKPKVRQRNG